MSWNYSPKEFIKVYRKFMEWEWYTDVNTTKLFLHCLLRANWKGGKWQGINYEPGEFITSLPSLSKETGLSIQQVRTSLEKLISTGELTSKTTDTSTGRKLSKNRIITVNNWDRHQGDNIQSNSQSNRQNVTYLLQNQKNGKNATGKLTAKSTGSSTGKKNEITIENTEENGCLEEYSNSQINRQVNSQSNRQVTGQQQDSNSRYKNIYKNNIRTKEEKKNIDAPQTSFLEDESEGLDLWDDNCEVIT